MISSVQYDVFLGGSQDLEYLHSFPTRRSSDLNAPRSAPPRTSRPTRSNESAPASSPVRAAPSAASARLRRSSYGTRSEEDTSELQSREKPVCSLLLEKNKND